MNNLVEYQNVVYALIAVMPRMAGIFMGLHYTNNSVIPRVIKIGIVAALALMVLPLSYNMSIKHVDLSGNSLLIFMIIFKEVGVGIIIGIIFNMPFHVFSLSGALMDAFKGAQLPYSGSFLSGGEGTPTGALVGYMSVIIMFSSGYFDEFIKYSILTYKTWPIHVMFPKYDLDDVNAMLNILNELFSKALFIISPVIIISILVDLGTLVLAKQLPQLNPTMLVMPIKALLISAFLILLVGKMEVSDYFCFECYVLQFERIIR
ncbi:flagellar biosynthetic protein FliR [Spartinivicinus poritis]|uniref:Flagellar biosynthetic protein FliR n=1 Tax=Spartinivicinus poritis TaxID=2994640 RepID=A0ABT5U3J7_9GAMM|nr:flagellar biosynthetic protein FliR [Spartinivicinus sp. A2-2]MDE1460940.1 flagellar biosynthetic protein FliR [Spartinivicinus sp. A2-2]